MLTRTWKYGETRLFRAEKLYTARNYQTFIETFKKNFPDFVYFCPFRKKELISAPLKSINDVYVPRNCLAKLQKMRNPDDLQMMSLELLNLISKRSGVALDAFGIHGSIALGMHAPESDIDFVVYGSDRFRAVEKSIFELVEIGQLSYIFGNRLDAARRFQGKYKGKIWMFNATRSGKEIKNDYGLYHYNPIAQVRFRCTVKNDEETMYRPALYQIEDYEPSDSASELPTDKIPQRVVSNIGCYRNIAREGSQIKVAGQLERVEPTSKDGSFYQVVVGTATSEEEYIWPT